MAKISGGTNLVLGVWLAVSAFLWTHSSAQQSNAWIVGVIAAVTAALGIGAPRLRGVSGVLALWIFVSAWLLPHASTATLWNSVIVAIIMFSVSIAETRGSISDHPPHSLS